MNLPLLSNNQIQKIMACSTLKGKGKTCLNNIGGIKMVYLNNQESITGYTLNATTKVIETLVYTEAFVSVETKRNTSMLAQSEKRNLTEGTNYVEATLSLNFKRFDEETADFLRVAGEGQRDLAGVVVDGNGIGWYVPYLQLATNETTTGTVKADGSKADTTFVGEYEVLAYRVADALLADLLEDPTP